jgi:LysM repeat protein/N-acetylmuramoyl-L-alanine amidase
MITDHQKERFILFYKRIFLSCLFTLCLYNSIFGDQIVHKVNERDTLYGLSLLYNTSVKKIVEINDLKTEIIRKGDELIIPDEEISQNSENRTATINTYTVQRGDTLSEIASRLNIEQKQIIQLNNIQNDSIRINQKLIIPGKAKQGEFYIVESGDTLSSISLLFDVSQDQIRLINALKNDALKIGQKIYVAPERPQTYVVEKGDSLWDIASGYKMTIDQLITFNHIQGEIIKPGQELKLYPYTIDNFDPITIEPKTMMAIYKEEPLEEYMNYEDGRQFQPSINYSETRLENPVTNYNQAREILKSFDLSISRERRLSNNLAGYHIVIDPGHGGLDPGTIVPSTNGNGETVYVVEDEYAYDISLRTYRLLKLHGADVTLTIISPNHQIRNSDNPSDTFVNMKNEVYNSSLMNRTNDDSCWPVGGSRGLRKRVEIAETAFQGVERDKRLYISIHADNSPDQGQGSMILYSSEETENLKNSVELAESLVPYLGASSSSGSQNLAVLRDNPAWAEVLIEIRNLFYTGNSWAIRYNKLREQDAGFIVEGLVNYAKNR